MVPALDEIQNLEPEEGLFQWYMELLPHWGLSCQLSPLFYIGKDPTLVPIFRKAVELF